MQTPLISPLGLGLALWMCCAVAPTHGQVQLRGTIVDSGSGQPIPCTIRITDSGNRILSHTDAFSGGFRCAGTFHELLPAGRTRIRASRGFEYRAAETTVELEPGKAHRITLTLERVVDLRGRRWFAGDSHVHMIHGERTLPVTFADVALAARAEDLQYLSLSHAWALDQPTPEALQTALDGVSTPDSVLTWNLEAPKNYYRGDAGRCLGHGWSLALQGRTEDGLDVIPLLLAASAGDYRSTQPSYANFESHQLIREQGGAVFYTHPLRWWTGAWGGQGGYPRRDSMRISNMAAELPLDVVAGPTFDGLDIITGAREFTANAKAFRLWALLLNHGHRLAATGSSDACFDRPGGAVPGVPRTYTYLPNGFSWPDVARATAAGHTFVTTGPLVVATLDDQPPGTAVTADGNPRTLSLEAWASGNDDLGLRRIEILRNGEPYRSLRFDPPTRSCRTNLLLRESADAWYCLRAWGGDEQAQQAVTGAFFFQSATFKPPERTRAHLTADILDARTGRALAGRLTEVVYAGPRARALRSQSVDAGRHTLEIAATSRLRAESPGYEPQTLSPFLDHPALVDFITGLQEDDLLEWTTYERVQDLLSEVGLTFRLQQRIARTQAPKTDFP